MTSKHPITCVAISAAIVLKLFAGTADAAGMAQESGRPIMVTDLSSRSGQLHTGRGVDIARVDGQIVLGL
jgi:hypothetical protein